MSALSIALLRLPLDMTEISFIIIEWLYRQARAFCNEEQVKRRQRATFLLAIRTTV